MSCSGAIRASARFWRSRTRLTSTIPSFSTMTSSRSWWPALARSMASPNASLRPANCRRKTLFTASVIYRSARSRARAYRSKHSSAAGSSRLTAKTSSVKFPNTHEWRTRRRRDCPAGPDQAGLSPPRRANRASPSPPRWNLNTDLGEFARHRPERRAERLRSFRMTETSPAATPSHERTSKAGRGRNTHHGSLRSRSSFCWPSS